MRPVLLLSLSLSAPEVLARRSVDEKVDMWALGVVMWVLLTGRHPFGAISDLPEKEVARRVAEMEPDLKVWSERDVLEPLCVSVVLATSRWPPTARSLHQYLK